MDGLRGVGGVAFTHDTARRAAGQRPGAGGPSAYADCAGAAANHPGIRGISRARPCCGSAIKQYNRRTVFLTDEHERLCHAPPAGGAGSEGMIAARGAAMEKKLCIASMCVAGVLLLLFILDIATGI